MPGHPDGQNYAVWRGPNFAANNSFSLSLATPFSAQGQVTNYASLIAMISPGNAGGAFAVINFYTDSTLSVLTKSLSWNLPAGVSLSEMFPVLGNFVTISVTTTDVVAQPMAISVFPTNTVAESARYQGTANVVRQISTSIPAATTQLFSLPFIPSGPGHYYFNDVAASAKLSFQIITLTVAGVRDNVLVNASSPVTSTFGDINLPEAPCAVSVANSDAIAHNAGFSLSSGSR